MDNILENILNPKKLIKLIDIGHITTSEVDNCYRDEIHLMKVNNHPLKRRKLEDSYFQFLALNKNNVDKYIKKVNKQYK
jgi:uncharacterized protein YdcH (DUF465 family)